MKLYFLILSFLSSFSVLSQSKINSSQLHHRNVDTYTLRNSSDRLINTNISGNNKHFKVDTTIIPSLSKRLNLLDQDINRRTLDMSISALRTSKFSATTTPHAVNITDKDKTGTFVYDSTDKTTPDNIGTVLVTVDGKRYKRVYTGQIEVEWFGAKGRPETPGAINSAAIQAACEWVSKTAGQVGDPIMPPNRDRPAIVHIPAGYYSLSRTINLQGAFVIKGDGGMSFGGTVLHAKTSGQHVFNLIGAPSDGRSNACEIRDLRIQIRGDSDVTDVSAIYSGDPPTGSSYNSLRVNNVWFQLQGGRQHAYTGLKGDDIKFTECTFDGTIGAAIILGGTATSQVITNFAMVNCTGFLNRAGLIHVNNVKGLLFMSNRIYGNAEHQTPYVIDALVNTINAEAIQIVGNRFDYCNQILLTKFDEALVTNNFATHVTGEFINFGGGGTIASGRFNDNIINGTWSSTFTINGAKYPHAPFLAYGTTVRNCEFQNTIIDKSNTSITAYYMPSSSDNTIDSKIVGFSLPYVTDISNAAQITSLKSNNIQSGFYTVNALGKPNLQAQLPPKSTGTDQWYLTVNCYQDGVVNNWRGYTLKNVKTNIVYEGGFDASTGLLTPWKQQSAETSLSNENTTASSHANLGSPNTSSEGKLTPALSYTFTPTNWTTTSTYTQVIPPGVLIPHTVYLVKAFYILDGFDNCVQSWIVPITNTKINSTVPMPDLTSNYSTLNGNSGNYLKLRQKSGTTSWGLEMALNKSNMASNKATIQIFVTPLF